MRRPSWMGVAGHARAVLAGACNGFQCVHIGHVNQRVGVDEHGICLKRLFAQQRPDVAANAHRKQHLPTTERQPVKAGQQAPQRGFQLGRKMRKGILGCC